jgi:hypothetical protein
MNVGDIVRVNAKGDHSGRYGVVRQVSESPDRCIVEFEDNQQQVDFDWMDVAFVRRGPLRTTPR